jgi:hypothetical protein
MEKDQEQLFRMMENYYLYVVDKVPVRQDGLFKTYLWSASLALALNFSLLQNHTFFWPLPFWKWASIVSLAAAFFVLAFCLDAIRGRPDQQVKFPDYWGYLAYLDEYEPGPTMKTLANDLKKQVINQSAEQTKRAIKLRASSKVLILSFAALAVAGVAYIFT